MSPVTDVSINAGGSRNKTPRPSGISTTGSQRQRAHDATQRRRERPVWAAKEVFGPSPPPGTFLSRSCSEALRRGARPLLGGGIAHCTRHTADWMCLAASSKKRIRPCGVTKTESRRGLRRC